MMQRTAIVLTGGGVNDIWKYVFIINTIKIVLLVAKSVMIIFIIESIFKLGLTLFKNMYLYCVTNKLWNRFFECVSLCCREETHTRIMWTTSRGQSMWPLEKKEAPKQLSLRFELKLRELKRCTREIVNICT
jgi:hypothetical protein